MPTSRIMTIGNISVEVEDLEMKQSDLMFFAENPRVYTVMHLTDDDNPSQKEIEEHMTKMDHVKTLKVSIAANGGLLTPIIVHKNVVIEGNSRLAAYRILAKDDPVKWGMIKATKLPDSTAPEQIHTILGILHLIGQTPWSPFEQAGYLYRTKQKSRRPLRAIAQDLGLKANEAELLHKVYCTMHDNKDMQPTKWSYYYELLKNRSIVKADEENPDINIVETIIDKIVNNEIYEAKDVRKIAEVVKSKNDDALDVLINYLDGEISLDEAVDLAGDVNRAQSINKGVEKFNKLLTENLRTLKQMMKTDPDLNMKLKNIRNSLENIIKVN